MCFWNRWQEESVKAILAYHEAMKRRAKPQSLHGTQSSLLTRTVTRRVSRELYTFSAEVKTRSRLQDQMAH